MASGYGPRGDARPKLTKIADGVPPGALNRRAATHRGGSLLLGHEGRGALIAASPSLSRNRDVLDMLKSAQKETRSTESLTTAWSPRYQQNRTLSGEVGRPISSLARDYSEHGVSSPPWRDLPISPIMPAYGAASVRGVFAAISESLFR